MSVQAKKIINFPEPAARAELSVRAESAHYGSLCAGAPPLPAAKPFNRRLSTLPACRWSEGLIGLCVALVFHLAWLAAAPTSEAPEPITPPTPIQVSLISSPQPRAEPAKPTPPKPQQKPKPVVKPKPKAKPRKPAPAKPKPLLSSSNSTADINAAEKTQAAQTPVESSPPPAPAATTAAPTTSTASRGAQSEAAPVTQPHLNADYLNNPPPAYPRISRRLGEQGKVLLRVRVNTDGTVAQLSVRQTSGFDRLDQAALKTVKNWRFVPARQGGRVVPAWVVVPVSFSLKG
jgi:protein TonB